VAYHLDECEKCGSTDLEEVKTLANEMPEYSNPKWYDRVLHRCRKCGHEQEDGVLRRDRVPPWVMI